MVPDRAGQPTQIQLHISLDDLLARSGDPASGTGPDAGLAGDPGQRGNRGPASGQPASGEPGSGLPASGQPGRDQAGPGGAGGGAPGSSASGGGAAGGGAAGGPGGWWQGAGWRDRLRPRLTPDGTAAPAAALPGAAAMPGDECDATIIPVVTGHIDHDLLDRLASLLTRPFAGPGGAAPGNAAPGSGTPGTGGCPSCGAGSGAQGREQVRRQVRDLIAANAVALLSGPHGLASYLRTGRLARPAGSVSLPLDVGKATDTIPPHLRRAVITRDRHCAAPGCLQPPAGCQVHHIIPRRLGGATKLTNMLLLCTFHHLIAVHQWNWTITLNPDGTTTMRSPDGSRVYHSHSPPPASAA